MSDIAEMLRTPNGSVPPNKWELAGADEIDRLRTALRRIRSLEEKNVEKYARSIAAEALESVDHVGQVQQDWKQRVTSVTNAQKKQKVKAMYRRWLKDEEFLDEIAERSEPQFSNVQKMLRNLGSAIAYAQAYVSSGSLTPAERPVSEEDGEHQS